VLLLSDPEAAGLSDELSVDFEADDVSLDGVLPFFA
jgi:hypothetical protein